MVVNPIYINLAVEGPLDEVILNRVLDSARRPFQVLRCYGKKGVDHLKNNLSRYDQAARVSSWIVLMDLDTQAECAPLLISNLLPHGQPNLFFRIAVRKVESWLLADRINFAHFLGIPASRILPNPERVLDPKQEVVNLARRSRNKTIVEDLVPPPGSSNKVGKNYSGKLSEFVISSWNLQQACQQSDSLRRLVQTLKSIKPRDEGA